MKKTTRQTIAISFIILLLGVFGIDQPTIAQTIVQAEVDQETIAIDEQLRLTVTVTGQFDRRPELDLTHLVDFLVRHEESSYEANIIRGQMVSRWVFVYYLQPLRQGFLVIDPIQVDIANEPVIYQTNPLAIRVTPPRALNDPLKEEFPLTDEAENLPPYIVKAMVDNSRPYLGQQVIYTFQLYRLDIFSNQPDYEAPSFTDFWNQTILSQPYYPTTISGTNYHVIEVRTAIFPATLGSVTIEPARLTIPGGLHNADKTYETKPLTVTVRSLPDGAPANFKGAVGRYHIRASLSDSLGRVNEPLTLIVEIEGYGNIAVISEPETPHLPNWREFDSRPTTDLQVKEEGVYGVRRFERLIFPTQPGEYEFPAIEFSYYDPQAEVYKTVSTEPMPIVVQPGETPVVDIEAAISPRSAIRPLKPVPASFNRPLHALTASPVYWSCWLLPALVVGGLWWFRQRRHQRRPSEAQLRRQQAYEAATTTLQAAMTDKHDQYAVARRALLNYLAGRLGQPTTGLTNERLLSLLKAVDFEPALIERLKSLLNQIDLHRYAPQSSATGSDFILEAQKLLNDLEKIELTYR